MLEPDSNASQVRKKLRESIARYFSVFGVVLLFPIAVTFLLPLIMYLAPQQIHEEHTAILLALVLVFSCFFWGYLIACAAGKNNWKPAIFGLVLFTATLHLSLIMLSAYI